MKLDEVRIGVRAGDGIIARLTDAVLVVPFTAGVDQGAVDRLLEVCRNGPVGGRLAELRAAADPGVPSFAVVAEVDGSLGVFVAGDACVAIAGSEPVLRLTGRDVDGWSVRVPDGFGLLEVGDMDGAEIDRRLDLRSGVVPGAGVALSPVSAAAAAARPAPALEASPPPVTKTRRKRAQPPPAATSAPAPAAAPAATPAPTPTAAPAPVVVPEAIPEVWGIRCKKGHFNDPEARYCGICGIHMVQDKAARVKGPRPVLGFLVLDDGTSYKLDRDYVLGSDPHGHDAVTGGRARPLVVKAEGDVISPIHARIELEAWDVLVSDCGSVYGTYVWSPGGTEWERLGPEQRVKLGAGSQVMVAQRGFMFQPVNKR